MASPIGIEGRSRSELAQPRLRDIFTAYIPPDHYIFLPRYDNPPPIKPGLFLFSPGSASKVYASGIVNEDDLWITRDPSAQEERVAYCFLPQVLSDTSLPSNPQMQEAFITYLLDDLHQVSADALVSMLRRQQKRRDDVVLNVATSRESVQKSIDRLNESIAFAQSQHTSVHDFMAICQERDFAFADQNMFSQLRSYVDTNLDVLARVV